MVSNDWSMTAACAFSLKIRPNWEKTKLGPLSCDLWSQFVKVWIYWLLVIFFLLFILFCKHFWQSLLFKWQNACFHIGLRFGTFIIHHHCFKLYWCQWFSQPLKCRRCHVLRQNLCFSTKYRNLNVVLLKSCLLAEKGRFVLGKSFRVHQCTGPCVPMTNTPKLSLKK